MKRTLTLAALVLAVGLGTTTFDAEAARRLGGGKSSGMQREAATAPAAPAKPGQPGAPNASPTAAPAAAAAPGAAAAAAPKRSWMGPLAGLAAGLGLAALASYLGFGEAFANMLLIGLAIMAVLLVVGFIMRKRMAAAQPAAAGWPGQSPAAGSPLGMERTAETPPSGQGGSLIGSRIGSGLAGGASAPIGTGWGQGPRIPAGFDAEGFARNAKDNFIALQAANDARDLHRLAEFLTPELLAEVRPEIESRDATPQRTEVFGLEAQVLEVVEEADRYVVSVRFTGGIRHAAGAESEDLVETWHLVKPRSGAGGWQVAGIQQG